jgi:hypothetical protein
MKRFGLLVVVALGLVVAGCASSTPTARRDDPPVRTRCLNDRNEGSTRPMIFLFCVESP